MTPMLRKDHKPNIAQSTHYCVQEMAEKRDLLAVCDVRMLEVLLKCSEKRFGSIV